MRNRSGCLDVQLIKELPGWGLHLYNVFKPQAIFGNFIKKIWREEIVDGNFWDLGVQPPIEENLTLPGAPQFSSNAFINNCGGLIWSTVVGQNFVL